MYESHLVFHFARLWGYQDGLANRPFNDQLLGNAQNPYDAMLGDLVGRVKSRYLIGEFKVSRPGISKEIHSASGKKRHRAALYDHLINDLSCLQLSRAGHWAAYADDTDQLSFERYVDAGATDFDLESGFLFSLRRHDVRNKTPIKPINFDEFRNALLCDSLAQRRSTIPFFVQGQGLPYEGFAAYIACMYAHLEEQDDAKGGTVLCEVCEDGTKIYVMDSLRSLVNNVYAALQRLQKPSQDDFFDSYKGLSP